MRQHRLFERFLEASPAPLEFSPRILTVKREQLEQLSVRRTLIDVVCSGPDGQLVAFPFIEYELGAGDPYIVPARLLGVGERFLGEIIAALSAWMKRTPQTGKPVLEVISKDADVAALLAEAGSPGFAATPGLSSYGVLQLAADRYEHAATRASGRRVLDLRAGAGFGARVLRGRAAHVDLVSDVPLHRKVAKRFGTEILTQTPEDTRYDLVTAFAIPYQEAESWKQRVQPFIEQGSRVAISILGDYVDEFRESAASSELLISPGADCLNRLDETLVWFEPPTRFIIAKPEAPAHPAAIAHKKLSILFALRSDAAEYPGGDSIQVYRTAQALRERGHRVEVTLEEEPRADDFDIVHLSNMTTPEDTLRKASAVESSAKAVVLMPIFIDHADEGAWGYNAVVWAFSKSLDDEQLQSNLRHIAKRAVAVDSWLPPPVRSEMQPGFLQAQRALLKKTDFLLANAFSEVYRIYRYVDASVPFAIVPSCTDATLYRKNARERFVSRYGLDDFVLMTGRLEPRKNQLSVAHKMRARGRPVVFIGRTIYPPYATMMRMYWPDNLTVMRFMPEEELAGAYAAARVLAIPSWDEVVSLSSLNGAVSETSLVLSRNGYEHEYFGPDAYYCDPGDADDIARAIDEAWAGHGERRERLAALSERVRKEYTWARAAEVTEESYLRVLAHNPRGCARRARAAS